MQEAFSHHFFLQEERQPLANCGAFAPKPVDLWTKSLSRSAADHWRICCAGKTRRRIGAYPAGPSFFHTSPRESLCFILLHCLAKRLFRYAASNLRADVLILRSGFFVREKHCCCPGARRRQVLVPSALPVQIRRAKFPPYFITHFSAPPYQTKKALRFAEPLFAFAAGHRYYGCGTIGRIYSRCEGVPVGRPSLSTGRM